MSIYRQVLAIATAGTILFATWPCMAAAQRRSSDARAAEVSSSPSPHVKRVEVLLERGGRVSWGKSNNLIAFDMQGPDLRYDVYVMNPDGSGKTCLTCDKGDLVPQGHNGNPEWHPSGEYIVFQAEMPEHPGSSSDASPGFGTYCDLWVCDKEGKRFWKLTTLPAAPGFAVLHPHFSRDGKMLSWSEAYEPGNIFNNTQLIGYWKIKVADFSIGRNGPELTNIREYDPGGPAFYENHGFSPDGRSLLFTSNFEIKKLMDLKANEIYLADRRGGKPLRLADEGYNEHAHFSPNGKKILWMSSAGNPNSGTDFWFMNPDGTEKVRLTNFNDKGDPIGRGEADGLLGQLMEPGRIETCGVYPNQFNPGKRNCGHH